jgi:hypothetical protein
MSTALKFSGFAEADTILRALPIALRGKVLDKSLNKALKRITDASMAKAPREGSAVGGVRYTPRRGERASRKRLAQSIGAVIRKYGSGEVLVGVGGPVKKHVGRHAHLVEFGFHHTTGGTFYKSGGRKRYAMKTVRFDRVTTGGGKNQKTWWARRTERDMSRTGTGKRGAIIQPRPYIETAFREHQASVEAEIMQALRTFAADIAKQEAKAAAKGAP